MWWYVMQLFTKTTHICSHRTFPWWCRATWAQCAQAWSMKRRPPLQISADCQDSPAPTHQVYEELPAQWWTAENQGVIWCHMTSGDDTIWCRWHTSFTEMLHILQGFSAWQLFIRPTMLHCSGQSPAWKQRGNTTIRITPSEQRTSTGLSWHHMISHYITWYGKHNIL